MENLKLHWRAPLQTKGFLKLIELGLAILTFSLVAGFSVNAHVRCNNKQTSDVVTFNFKYPFSEYAVVNGSTETMPETFEYRHARSGAEWLVTWGVLTMFYCVIALVVYVVFTANERLERVVDCLVYLDLGFHILWVLCFFIACVEWTIAFRGMRNFIINDILSTDKVLSSCGSDSVPITFQDSYSQAAIGSVFGFLSVIVWIFNIYWIVIDTAFYIQWMARRSAGGSRGSF